MKISYLKQYALSAMLIAMNLSVTSCAKESGNNPQYIIDMGDNRYMVDYDSLAKSDMHIDDQFRVARALRAGDAYMKGPVASIGGLSADCNVKKKWHIPVGVDCKLEASAAATANLASLGTFAITNAICLIIDAEDLEITEPICDGILQKFVNAEIKPKLEICAKQGDSTELDIAFTIIPPSGNANAFCK